MTQNKATMWILFYTLLFLIGTTLAYFAYSEYRKTQKLLHSGVKTTATVIDLEVSRGDDGDMYKPVFEFTDRSLVNRTFKNSISSSPAPYKIGEKVKIIYNQRNLEEVKTISFWGLYRWCVILLAIASPLLIIGGSYLLYARG
jgi:hypothetical protein